MIVIDVETYRNYFLLSAKHLPTGKTLHFEMHNDSEINIKAIRVMMKNNTTVSFNGLSYDLPIIALALTGATNEELKEASDKIITGNTPAWMVAQSLNIRIPKNWDHIDLINVAPGQSSLKIYSGRLGAPKMQDLPITPDGIISDKQAPLLRSYCENDLDVTERLYRSLEKQIDLRVAMSEQYGVDLRSKSDAQIAETVIKSELTKLTGQRYSKPMLDDDYGFQYKNPGIVSFKTDELRAVFERVLQTRFTLKENGSVEMPEWLKKDKIAIGKGRYQMGIGGLHSCEKRRCIKRGEGESLFELDVASYYPNIILQQQLAPETLGVPFLKIYQSLVDRRIKAKHSGDKVSADTLKICVNGSFGKLGSKYSALYAPDLLIQTTITGQLALLMLIEALELVGITVVSANTDGIVVHTTEDREEDVEAVAFEWMMTTSYELERTDYDAVASRDVNTYLAVKPDGSTKGKGAFASGGLMKNPDLSIIYSAVEKYVADGTPIENTIRECRDILAFVIVRQVNGGALWRGQSLGKAVRYYYSTQVPEDECIEYAKNGNRVPKSAGAKPLMDLPDAFPTDIDYATYITAAEKLLCEVGL